MEIIESAICVQLTSEEKSKIREAYEIICDFYDLAYTHKHEYIYLNINKCYSIDQLEETCDFMSDLTTSYEINLKNE